MRWTRWVALGALAGVGLVGCADGPIEPAAVGVEETAEARGERPAAKGETIVDVAIAVNAEGPYAGLFDTLIGAVVSADLVGALSEVGQKTVFAPTDAAFEALGLTPDNIGDVPTAALTDILLYHVARGNRDAAELTDADQIRMLNGAFNEIEAKDGSLFIGNEEAEVIVADVPASNGIIHVIDAVLIPGDGGDAPGEGEENDD